MLEHDSEGFLIADRTAINEEGVNYLEQINDQLAEIKDLVSDMVSTASANPVANSQEQNTPEPATNDASISVQPQIQANAELNPTIEVSVNIELTNPVGSNTVNRSFNRDALGRFIPGNTNLAEIINADNAQTVNNSSEQQRVINNAQSESVINQPQNTVNNRVNTDVSNRQRDAQGRFIRGDNTAEAMAEVANNSTNSQSSQNTDNRITNTVLPGEIVNSAQQTVNNRTDNRLDSRSSSESSSQNSNAQVNSEQNNQQSTSNGRQRDARGRFIRGDNTAEAGESGNRGRDNRGRFTAGSRSPGERQEERGLIGKLIDAFSGRSGDGVDLQDVDPAIRAANEIKELASPIFNTIGAAWNVAGKIGGLIPRRRASENTSEPVAPTANQPQRRTEPTNASEQTQASADIAGNGDSASNPQNRRRRTSRTSESVSNANEDSRTSVNERTSTSEDISENTVDQQRNRTESTTNDRQSAEINQSSQVADVSINNRENSSQINRQRGNEEINRTTSTEQINSATNQTERLINNSATTDSRIQQATPQPQITRDVIIAEQNVAEPIIENTGISAREETRQSKAFKRFFADFRVFRREDGVFQKTTNKLLKEISERTAQAESSNSNGFLGAFLGGLTPMMLALLTTVSGAIISTLAGLAPMLLSAIGSVLALVFSPIGLAIASAATVAWGLFTEQGREFFSNSAGFIKEKFAQVVDYFAQTFPETTQHIKDTWNSVVDSGQATWDWVKDSFTPVIDNANELFSWLKTKWDDALSVIETMFDGVAGFIKDKFNIDIKTQAKKAVEITKKTIEKGVTLAKTVTESVKTSISEKIDGAKQAAERAYNVAASTAGSALEKVMPKGYRHKALFDGVKGGDALTKYGSYTDEESARIRELKTTGANTSANLKNGMPVEVQDKIAAQAKKHNLDPVMMQKIAAMESGGNANAISSTGTLGIYQFTGQTASHVGIKNRFDVDQNIEGGMKLAQENIAALKSKGLPITAENIYMMHQLGSGAAPEVIKGAMQGKSKSELSASAQKGMNLNFGSNSRTAADYVETNKKALDARYVQVVKNTTATGSSGPIKTNATNSAVANNATTTAQTTLTKTSLAPTVENALAQQQAFTNILNTTPQTISVSAIPKVNAPTPLMPAKIPEAPTVTIPLASNDNSTNQTVVTNAGDVGQDVSDRGIAHIVTGGIAPKGLM